MYLNDHEISYFKNIRQLLLNFGYDLEKIVVLVNGEMVKKTEWDDFVLKQDDYVEVVSFVGGG